MKKMIINQTIVSMIYKDGRFKEEGSAEKILLLPVILLYYNK